MSAISLIVYAMIVGFSSAIAIILTNIINILVGNVSGTITIYSFVPIIIFVFLIVILVFIVLKTRLRMVSLGRRVV